MKPCHPNESVEACGLCRLYATNEAYRRHVDGLPLLPVNAPAPAFRYRGDTTGEQVECEVCTGKVMLKVFACELRGRCLPAKELKGIQCCETCPDRPECCRQ